MNILIGHPRMAIKSFLKNIFFLKRLNSQRYSQNRFKVQQKGVETSSPSKARSQQKQTSKQTRNANRKSKQQTKTANS